MFENPYLWHTHVTTYDTDPDRRLRLSSQLKLQQEVGEMQLAERGAGFGKLLEAGIAFVLTRTRSVIFRPPLLGERMVIRTWPRGTQGAQFFRCYEFLSEQSGELLISSVSAFALVDTVGHRPLRPRVFYEKFPDVLADIDLQTACPDPQKTAPNQGAEPVGAVKVTYSMTDWNHHLNNTVYADLLTDHMPDEAFGKRFSSFEIEYLREALPGETVTLSVAEQTTENGVETALFGAHDRGECFRARAVWKKEEK